MNKRLIKIDGSMLSDHSYLNSQDECYFYGDYTAKQGYAYSETNRLILNFKKSVDRCGTSEWQYKQNAITQAANFLKAAIRKDANVTFVPVPPSKAKNDPLYDDRMLQLLRQLCADWSSPDIRELVVQSASTEPVHKMETRPSPDDLVKNYSIDEQLAILPVTRIVLVDDVLTTGCHFKAMKQILLKRFPNVTVIGLFLARRVPEPIDLSGDFVDLNKSGDV